MKPTLEDAIALAALKHKGQTDKAGAPYILHPLRVMLGLGPHATEDERIAAVLHDVIEDCDVPFEYLEKMRYSDAVIEALRGVTKTDETELRALHRAISAQRHRAQGETGGFGRQSRHFAHRRADGQRRSAPRQISAGARKAAMFRDLNRMWLVRPHPQPAARKRAPANGRRGECPQFCRPFQ